MWVGKQSLLIAPQLFSEWILGFLTTKVFFSFLHDVLFSIVFPACVHMYKCYRCFFSLQTVWKINSLKFYTLLSFTKAENQCVQLNIGKPCLGKYVPFMNLWHVCTSNKAPFSHFSGKEKKKRDQLCFKGPHSSNKCEHLCLLYCCDRFIFVLVGGQILR